jgi:hypothetical protein
MSTTNTLPGYRPPAYQNGSASTAAISNMSAQNSVVIPKKGGSVSTVKFDNVPSSQVSNQSNYPPSQTGTSMAKTTLNLQNQAASASSGGGKRKRRSKSTKKRRRKISRKNKSRRRK